MDTPVNLSEKWPLASAERRLRQEGWREIFVPYSENRNAGLQTVGKKQFFQNVWIPHVNSLVNIYVEAEYLEFFAEFHENKE
jgi:hypothetical protein